MTEKAWKQEERKVGQTLGGERNPLSGSNSRHTAGDVIQTPYFVDCKLTSSENATGEKFYQLEKETIEEVDEQAQAEDKTLGLLTVRWKHCSDRYVILNRGDLKTWVDTKLAPGVELETITSLVPSGTKQYRLYRKHLQDLADPAPGEDIQTLTISWPDERGHITTLSIITWEALLWILGRMRQCPCGWRSLDVGDSSKCPDCGNLLEVSH